MPMVESCRHVAKEGAPVCYIIHERDTWHALCGGTHTAADAVRVPTETLCRDSEVAWVFETLPEEWEAERTAPDSAWMRRPLDETLISELP